MFLCFPIALFMLSMSRRASIPLLNELVCERENVYVSVSVWLSGGCSNSSTVLLHPSLNSDSRELCVIESLSVKSSVWSLGEGQAPEELDKPIETPPLSTLLIEKPQSATVSVGELTFNVLVLLTVVHGCRQKMEVPHVAGGLSPEDITVLDSASWNKRKTFPPYHSHLYLCDVQKWALGCKTDFVTSSTNRPADLSILSEHRFQAQCTHFSAVQTATYFGVSCI